MPSQISSTPRSGIQVTSDGDRHIPVSTRADGSLRKEIKIRPGYRPPEDVEVYKNRTAEAWKGRGTGGIPGASNLTDQPDHEDKIAAGKNAKRREARKRAKVAVGGEENDRVDADEHDQEQTRPTKHTGGKTTNVPAEKDIAEALTENQDPEAEREKQARNLRKKLRQARELKAKKDTGEGLLPEQFAKVIKIQELIRQLDSLGFDDDGARKAKDAFSQEK